MLSRLSSSIAPAASRLLRVSSVQAQYLPFRRFNSSFDFTKDPPIIRINSIAPNFNATTNEGAIDFHDFITKSNSWVILFSHPADFTPVCTTELNEFNSLLSQFGEKNAKLIALSTDDVKSHLEWIKDLEEISKKKFQFPIIDDSDKKISYVYNMIDQESFENLPTNTIVQTIRSVYIIDPSKKIRAIITYPPSVGRNTSEVLRALEALQTTDKFGVATPVNWQKGQKVIIPPTLSDADAKKKFGDFTAVKPYLRYTNLKE
ncbi:peroxiredoxin [Ascoidea rubescens DSM 1968]|uniref:Thioredoxin-like protein n=1 Tax=Ascoidea rubescens DSM 1968 TaxID=1344418 RepID=A0A1D2V9Q5_9ASCO|nr:thioredoxin-like protein [Ascoidea rubescens DSM 1968]ODV58227.1 thioredoxin-like protein [Ascoidea rubescens DSM 1968]